MVLYDSLIFFLTNSSTSFIFKLNSNVERILSYTNINILFPKAANLPSNIIEEAYVVLKSKKKAKKLQKIEKNNQECIERFSDKDNYVVKEAELLVSDYLEKMNNNKMILNVKTKRKYKRLKNYAYISSIVMCLQFLMLIIK